MEDLNSYENDYNKSNKHVRNLTLALIQESRLAYHIKIHTPYIALLLFFLIVLTGCQGLSVWKGDFWKLHHHYDYFSSDFYQTTVNVSEMLECYHPVHAYRKANPQIDKNHEFHHSNLEKVVSSHYQTAYLKPMLFVFLIMISISIAARLWFTYIKRSFAMMFITMFIFIISSVLLGMCLIAITWLLFNDFTIWLVLKFVFTLCIFFIELAGIYDLYHYRSLVMYLSHNYPKYVQEEMQKSNRQEQQIIQFSLAEVSDFINLGIMNMNNQRAQQKMKTK